MADFATFGSTTSCSCQGTLTGNKVTGTIQCNQSCSFSFLTPYDALSGYILNITQNTTLYTTSGGGTSAYRNSTGFLDSDSTIFNGNERRIDLNTSTSTTDPLYMYFLWKNNSFPTSLFNSSTCSNWPYTCTWYNFIQAYYTLTTKAGGSTGIVNISLNWINYTWNYTADTFAPNVSLMNPQTNTWSKTALNAFLYNVTDEKDIFNCSLIINNKINMTNLSVQKNAAQNISSTLPQGFYSWSINCSDNTSRRNTGNASTRTIKIDYTPPAVNAESPQNNTVWSTSSIVPFKYNTSDNLGNVTICSLYVDQTFDQSDTQSPVTQNTSRTLSKSLANGLHNWTINCTDEATNVGTFGSYNLTINYVLQTIYPQTSNYLQGENVTLIGQYWGASTAVMINLTMSNGTNLNWTILADGTGAFITNYYVNYTYPIGIYNITAKNTADPSKNSTNSFNVLQRPVFVSVNRTNYFEGERVYFNGTGMSINSSIIINITSPAQTYSITVNSNGTGQFNGSWQIPYAGPPGSYNLSSFDGNYYNLNSTTNFTVSNRVANVSTNLNNYFQYMLVIINGSWYYPLGSVSITIKNNDDGGTATYSNNSNYAGEIGTIFNLTNACAGNYSVITQDALMPELNAQSNFTLVQDYTNYSQIMLPFWIDQTAGTGVPTLSNVNVSDGTMQTITMGSAGNYYLVGNFSNTIPINAIIKNVTFINEYIASNARLTNYNVRWYDGAAYQQICTSTPSLTKINESCDLTNYINTPQKANYISIMANYSKTGSPTDNVQIDFIRLNITYQIPKPCASWATHHPRIDIISFDDMFIDATKQIDLLSGTTTSVLCNVTVSDSSGAADISLVNATIYLKGNESSQNDNSTHYSNSSCDCTTKTLNSKECLCYFDVLYYAENGTWFCNASAYDSLGDKANNITNASINSFISINLTTESSLVLDFGNIKPGENSTTSKQVNVTNMGNQQINISAYAYANSSGDNYSMSCNNQQYWINLSYLRYNLTDQNWEGMYLANGTFQKLGLSVKKSVGSTITNTTYWRFLVPTAIKGTCNGTIVFAASAS